MGAAAEGSALRPGIRVLLEAAFGKLAEDGHIPDRGEREVRFRLDERGRIRWFEPTRIRVPASELEPPPAPT
jgi:hypothetical protein